MSTPKRSSPATRRRDFLRLAVLAPVAASCAGAHAAARDPASAAPPPGPAATAASATPPRGGASAEADAIAAVRAAPLPSDAEPAFVFRALRAGEGGR